MPNTNLYHPHVQDFLDTLLRYRHFERKTRNSVFTQDIYTLPHAPLTQVAILTTKSVYSGKDLILTRHTFTLTRPDLV
jgi:hypothetical protein